MGTTQSTSYINTLNNPPNVQLQCVNAYIQELQANFNYMSVYYTENSEDLKKNKRNVCILEKTDNYDQALSTLKKYFVDALPIVMYIHPITHQIYRVMHNAKSIDIIHADGLDMFGNLYVNQSTLKNNIQGDLIES